MFSEAEYWKVEEHEPIYPHLRAGMSPPPTRLNRRNVDDVGRNVRLTHPNVNVYVWHFTGAMGRTQPDRGIGIDLQNARAKTAIGSLPNTI